MSHYAVKVSSAKVPTKWGRYVHVGVLRTTGPAVKPTAISDRALGVVEVVAVWERRFQGKNYPNGECAASKALAEAEALVQLLS